MAQLFDPMLEPGTVIDEETGLPIPNMPIVRPAVEALDAGLQAAANATTPVARAADPSDPFNIAVDVDPLGPARTGHGSYSIGGAEPETFNGQITQAASALPAMAGQLIPTEPPAGGLSTVPTLQQYEVDPKTGLPIGPYGPTNAPDLDALRKEFGYSPEGVQQKTGQVSTTTSQKEMTPEARAAIDQLTASQKDLQAAKQMELSGVKQEQDALGQLEKKTAEITQKWKNAEANRIATENREIERLLSEADTRQKELAAMNRADFWGSQSEAQRWSTALSIGLGSFGQALTGSGKNVGSVILQQRIDQFNRVQDQKFEQKKAEIEGLRMSASKRKEMIGALEKEFDARKLSELSAIEAELKPRIAAAKTPQMQAKLMREYSAVEDNKARAIADIADKYAAQTSQTRTEDIYKEVVGKPSYPEGAELGKLAEQWVNMARAFSPLSKAFKQNPRAFDTPATRTYYSKLLLTEGLEAAPMGAGKVLDRLVDSGLVAVSADPNKPAIYSDEALIAQEAFAKRDPEAYNFFQQQRALAAGLIRGDTGAAITAEEWKLAYEQYLVLPWDTPEQAQRKMEAAAARLQLRGKIAKLL